MPLAGRDFLPDYLLMLANFLPPLLLIQKHGV
jgi:hypothetical protein